LGSVEEPRQRFVILQGMNDMTLSSRPAVLVVEDEFWVMQDVAETLREHGFEDICAATGEEALPILEKRPDIQVVFTDINMPGRIDGIALAKAVAERWPDKRVIITSGRYQPAEIPDKWPFISKPYDPRAVASRIARMLGLR
jgi:DNA-binding NtrC family response regulator